jgi:hypothetical protein
MVERKDRRSFDNVERGYNNMSLAQAVALSISFIAAASGARRYVSHILECPAYPQLINSGSKGKATYMSRLIANLGSFSRTIVNNRDLPVYRGETVLHDLIL